MTKTNDDDIDNLAGRAENRDTENPTLGTHLGYEVHISVRREPKGEAYPDDFAVNMYIPQADRNNIDIARVDTSRRPCHIDRMYLPRSHEKHKHDKGFQTSRPEGAVKYFTEDDRWRDWVERYEENHGLP